MVRRPISRGTVMAPRHGLVGMLPAYCQLLIQPIAIPLAVGHVVQGDGRVVVLAVVDPVGALGDRQRGGVGEGEVVGQDVAPAAGVVVDELHLRLLALVGRRSKWAQSRRSLFGPVSLSTTSPSTSRLTVVSMETGGPARRRA